MEPKALAASSGGGTMLVPTGSPSKTAPSTPAAGSGSNRRASALWIRTPENVSHDDSESDEGDSDHDMDHDDATDDWKTVLTPVPKTPAPEAIARFAANVSPDTPSSVDDQDAEDESLLNGDASPVNMLTRTCPPKASNPTSFKDLGEGILRREKDEGVLMRLMAARRKSLQHAPKIGSPLAKAWKY